jgi:hypothetical protein
VTYRHHPLRNYLAMPLAPLINIRKDYFLAKSQQQSAHIKLQHSQKNVQRLRALQRDQAVSTRKLHEPRRFNQR